MPNMLFANNANTTLASSLTNVATTMSVTSAAGFPSPTGSQYFYCTLADAATQTTIEIVKVTAVSGTTFTIVRGQDGTSGTIFASGAVVSLRLVRASLQDFPLLDEANTFSGPSSTFTNAPIFSTALGTTSGGTGLTSLTAGYIPYGNGTSAFSSSANLSFNGTNLSVSGVTNSTSFNATNAPPAISFDSTGQTVTLTNGSSITFSSFSGMILVNDISSSGQLALMICGSGATVIASQISTTYSTLSGAGTYRFYFSSGAYVFSNNSGTTVTFAIFSLKTRSSP